MRRTTIISTVFILSALAVVSGVSTTGIEKVSASVSETLEILGVTILALLSAAITLNSKYIADVLRELFRKRPYSREAEEQSRVRNALLVQVFILVLIALLVFYRTEIGGLTPEEGAGLNNTVKSNASSTQVQLVNSTQVSLESRAAAGRENIERALLITTVILVLIPTVAVMAVLLRGREEESHRYAPPSTEVKKAASDALNRLRAGEDLRAVICSLYESFCENLEKRGLAIARSMTAREIMNTAHRAFPELPEKALFTLTTLFEKARYSDHALSATDKHDFEVALSEIIGKLPA